MLAHLSQFLERREDVKLIDKLTVGRGVPSYEAMNPRNITSVTATVDCAQIELCSTFNSGRTFVIEISEVTCLQTSVSY